MSRLDDRLTDELERAARPADTAGVFERIDGRRVRRHRARRVRAGALAVVVIAGSIGGFAYLTRAFGPTRIPGGGGEASVRDGLIVVSVFDQFGLGHLWLDDPTTGERRPLMVESPTQTATSDGSPAVSPDGLTVAFARSDGRHGSAIYTVGIDGEGLTKIADPGVDPAWSPDGSRIAFTRDLLGSGGLWTMNADGSDPTLVLGTKTLSIGDPAWSPDGTTLAFEAFRFRGRTARLRPLHDPARCHGSGRTAAAHEHAGSQRVVAVVVAGRNPDRLLADVLAPPERGRARGDRRHDDRRRRRRLPHRGRRPL